MDMDTVHEQTEGNLRLKVVTDPEPHDPRGDDQLGVMVATHPDYQLGDKDAEAYLEALRRLGAEGFVRWLRAFHGTTVVLPLYLLDHSGLSMRAGGGFGDVDPGGWDTSMVGFIFDTTETRDLTGVSVGSIAEQLNAEVDEYDRYLRGEAYGFVIERLVVCDQGHEHATVVESLWGFSDDNDALSEGRSVLETLVKVEQPKAEAKPCPHCGRPIVRRDRNRSPVGSDWMHIDAEPTEGELTILSVTDKVSGTITTLHRTHAGAKAALATFVRQAWDVELYGPEPVEDQVAIDRYFADGDESYYLDSARVED